MRSCCRDRVSFSGRNTSNVGEINGINKNNTKAVNSAPKKYILNNLQNLQDINKNGVI